MDRVDITGMVNGTRVAIAVEGGSGGRSQLLTTGDNDEESLCGGVEVLDTEDVAVGILDLNDGLPERDSSGEGRTLATRDLDSKNGLPERDSSGEGRTLDTRVLDSKGEYEGDEESEGGVKVLDPLTESVLSAEGLLERGVRDGI